MTRLWGRALLAGLLLAATAAHATTVVQVDEVSLIRTSDVVALFVVEQVVVREIPLGPGVFTDVALRVVEGFAGAPQSGELVVLRIPGGELPDRQVFVEGMPTFAEGDEFVGFLEELPSFPDRSGLFLPVGLNQGVWRRDSTGLYAPGFQPGMLAPPDAGPAPGPLGLAELRAAISRARVAP